MQWKSIVGTVALAIVGFHDSAAGRWWYDKEGWKEKSVNISSLMIVNISHNCPSPKNNCNLLNLPDFYSILLIFQIRFMFSVLKVWVKDYLLQYDKPYSTFLHLTEWIENAH